jgi:hypothetical protein
VGAKAGILVLGDQDFAEPLRQLPRADAERTVALVAENFPGYQVEPVQGLALDESTYPDDDVVYALSAPGIDVMCDQRFVLGKPSELPAARARRGSWPQGGTVCDALGGRLVRLRRVGRR